MDALGAETPMRVMWVTPGFSVRSQGTPRLVTGHAALEDARAVLVSFFYHTRAGEREAGPRGRPWPRQRRFW
jgi:hypothetical protein